MERLIAASVSVTTIVTIAAAPVWALTQQIQRTHIGMAQMPLVHSATSQH